MKKRKKGKAKSKSPRSGDSISELTNSDLTDIELDFNTSDYLSTTDWNLSDIGESFGLEETLGRDGERRGSVDDVARWMLGEIRKTGELYQDRAAQSIGHKFGGGFLYDNPNGNPAIAKIVLEEFKKLTKKTVVWVRTKKMWRLREKGDPSGRMVD